MEYSVWKSLPHSPERGDTCSIQHLHQLASTTHSVQALDAPRLHTRPPPSGLAAVRRTWHVAAATSFPSSSLPTRRPRRCSCSCCTQRTRCSWASRPCSLPPFSSPLRHASRPVRRHRACGALRACLPALWWQAMGDIFGSRCTRQHRRPAAPAEYPAQPCNVLLLACFLARAAARWRSFSRWFPRVCHQTAAASISAVPRTRHTSQRCIGYGCLTILPGASKWG